MNKNEQHQSHPPEESKSPLLPGMDDEILEAKIASVAYGDAGWLTRYQIKRLATKYPVICELLQSYKETAIDVDKFSKNQPSCPDSVINQVFEHVNRPTLEEKSKSIYKKPFFIGLSWATATAAMVMLLVVISNRQHTAVVPIPSDPVPHEVAEEFTPEEVELATEDAKRSLALVARMLNQTESDLRQDIFKSRISKPINHGLSMVSDIFQESEDNLKSKQ